MNVDYAQMIVNSFEDELKKIAGAEMKIGKGVLTMLGKHKREIGGAAGGILAYDTLSTAEKDRRMGRQIRIQQGY